MTKEEIEQRAAKKADEFVKKFGYPPDANSLWKTYYKAYLEGYYEKDM